MGETIPHAGVQGETLSHGNRNRGGQIPSSSLYACAEAHVLHTHVHVYTCTYTEPQPQKNL